METPTWDDAATASAYESFCRRHSRYRRANAELVAHADIEPHHHVIDFAAGTGRTTDAILAMLGQAGRVICVEPARAMRDRGERRLTDARVIWTAELTEHTADRILCSAAMWQMPIAATIEALSARLRRGGALAFNIPALYLLEPDAPGGGADPMLLGMITHLMKGAPASTAISTSTSRVEDVARALETAGLQAKRWEFRQRLTQAAYRDWLAIPIVSKSLLGHLDTRERRARLDAAYAAADQSSWRWERWIGWTAWKP
jgi:hypothetical protein